MEIGYWESIINIDHSDCHIDKISRYYQSIPTTKFEHITTHIKQYRSHHRTTCQISQKMICFCNYIEAIQCITHQHSHHLNYWHVFNQYQKYLLQHISIPSYLGQTIIAMARRTAKISIFRPVAPSSGFNALPSRCMSLYQVAVCITR